MSGTHLQEARLAVSGLGQSSGRGMQGGAGERGLGGQQPWVAVRRQQRTATIFPDCCPEPESVVTEGLRATSRWWH